MFINKKKQKYFSSKTEVFIFHFLFVLLKRTHRGLQHKTHTHTDLRSAAAVVQIRYELYQFTDNYNLLKV